MSSAHMFNTLREAAILDLEPIFSASQGPNQSISKIMVHMEINSFPPNEWGEWTKDKLCQSSNGAYWKNVFKLPHN